jgi:hypothetical protein
LFRSGLIPEDKLVTVQREDLVASVIGGTAIKTKAVLKEADGGVLFVDEAYRLVPKSMEKDFGPESLETIMTVMEGGAVTVTSRPSIVFAGYQKEMEDMMIKNRGLKLRFTHTLIFDNYTPVENTKIFKQQCLNIGHRFSESINWKVIEHKVKSFGDLSNENGGFGGRLVASSTQARTSRLTARILNKEEIVAEDLSVITMEDILNGLDILRS